MTICAYHVALLWRFLFKIDVDPVTGCWMWRGATDKDGYAVFWFEGRTVRGHRWAYQRVNGVTLLPTVYACHTCDRPGCVNPAHIKPGPAKFNSDDKVSKGRQPSKLTARDVWSMRCLFYFGGHTHEQLAETFGVSAGSTGRATRGETWAHVPSPRDVPEGQAPAFDASGVMTSASQPLTSSPTKDAA